VNAERLLALFDRVADAPDAIPRLRRFVLDLAVRGKLVEQDLSDEPVGVRLAAARRNLEAMAEAARRVRWKPSEPISESEIDKVVPPGWVAARVNDTALYVNGLAFKPTDWKPEGVPIVRIQNLTDRTREFNYALGDFPDEVTVRDGDLLVSWSATLEAFKWDRGEGVLNQHIFRVIPDQGLTDRDFLLLLLRSAVREMADSEHAHGLVMTHINRGPFLNHVVAIPPLGEQHRIVARVEELMGLLHRLDSVGAEREATRDRFTRSNLARATMPNATCEASANNLHSALDSLATATTRRDQVKLLRQTILNLAVSGRLVEQDLGDESAAEQLDRISAEKARAMRATGDRRIRVAPPPDAGALKLPLGWCAQSFENLFLFIDYRGQTPAKTPDGVPLITAKNVRMGHLAREPREFIAPRTYRSWMTRGFPKPGDIFFTTEAPLANVCVNDLEEPFALAQRVICLQPFGEINTRYVMFAMMSDMMQERIGERATGLTARGIKAAKLKPLVLPIPPLAEQHRIVAKLDFLLALCDRLEDALTTVDSAKQRLLEALISEALASDAALEEAA
jgi:type I restriction enzyme, S subunit